MSDNVIRRLDFYTDGAHSSKSDMGGWAAICVENNMIIDVQQGFEAYTTNNRMELKAFVSVLENMNNIASPEHTEVHIYCDSAYVLGAFGGWYRNWMKNDWKTADKQEVKNKDIIVPAVALYIKLKAKFPHFFIEKVPAHSGVEFNEYVDRLAVKNRKLLEEVQ